MGKIQNNVTKWIFISEMEKYFWAQVPPRILKKHGELRFTSVVADHQAWYSQGEQCAGHTLSLAAEMSTWSLGPVR